MTSRTVRCVVVQHVAQLDRLRFFLAVVVGIADVPGDIVVFRVALRLLFDFDYVVKVVIALAAKNTIAKLIPGRFPEL